MPAPTKRVQGKNAIAEKTKNRYKIAANLEYQKTISPIKVSKISPRTEGLFATQYNEFTAFYSANKGKEFDAKDPDALSYNTLRNWIQALCDTSTTTLTVNTVEDYLDRAILHIERKFLLEVSRDTRRELKRYIREKLVLKQNEINRDLFHILDLQALLRFFWCRDLYRYLNERSRLQFDFLLLLIAYTGSRPGAIVESRASDSSGCSSNSEIDSSEIDKERVPKYGDIKFLVIGHRVEGIWKNCFALDVKFRLLKMHQDDPTKELRIILSEIEDGHELYFCPVLPFLALAFDDAAFANGLTLDTLLRIRQTNRQAVREISWRPDILDTPICRMGGTKGGAGLKYSSAYRDFSLAAFRAGFRREITFYWMRRNFANKIDDKVSDAKRNQLMCHSRSQTFNSYISKVSLIDVQAIMLDKSQRRHVIEAAQRLNSMWDERAPTELPLCIQAEIEKDEDYNSTLIDRDNCKDPLQRKKLTTRACTIKEYLTRERLRQYREEWFINQLATEEGLEPELYFEEFAERLSSYIRFPDRDGSYDIRLRIAFGFFGKKEVADNSSLQRQLILDCITLCKISGSRGRRVDAYDNLNVECLWQGCNEIGVKGGIQSHMRRHISKGRKCKWRDCAVPDTNYFASSDLADHIHDVHGLTICVYTCSFCPHGTEFSTFRDWKEHCKQHTDTLDAGEDTQHRDFHGTCLFCLLATTLCPTERLRIYGPAQRSKHMEHDHAPGKEVIICPHRSCRSSINGGRMSRQEYIEHASAPRKKRKAGCSEFILPGAKRAAIPKRSLRVSKDTSLMELFQDWYHGTSGTPFAQLVGKVQYLDNENAKLFRLCRTVSDIVSGSENPIGMVDILEKMRLAQGLSSEEFVNSFQKTSIRPTQPVK